MSSTQPPVTEADREALSFEILQTQSRLGDLYRQIKVAAQSNSALAQETASLQRHLASLVDPAGAAAPESKVKTAGGH